jgi:hypothetical protein
MSNLSDGFIMGALEGTTLEVRTAVAPPITIDLSPRVGQAPSALTSALQPTIIIRRDGLEVGRVAPAGEVDPDGWKKVVAVTAGVLLLVVVFSFLVSRKG